MKNLLLILFLLICTSVVAQKYDDVVYLKDGSSVRGLIIEHVLNESIKIQSGKNQFVYQYDQIAKLAKEPRMEQIGMKKGLGGLAEIGSSVGIGDLELNFLKVNAIALYRLNPHFSVGLGTGIRYLFDSEGEFESYPSIPVLLDLRYTVLNRPLSPYLSVSGGYLFKTHDTSYDYQYFLNSAIGLNVKTSENTSINIGVGYDLQFLMIEELEVIDRVFQFGFYTPIYGLRSTLNQIHGISLNVGFNF